MVWHGANPLDQCMTSAKVLLRTNPGVMSERGQSIQDILRLTFVTSVVDASISLSSADRSVKPGSACLA